MALRNAFENLATEAKQDRLINLLDEVEGLLVLLSGKNFATESTLARRNNAAATLMQLQFGPDEKVKVDDVEGGDRYHGRASRSASDGDASWEVVKMFRDASGNITQMQYKAGVSWDNRALSVNWS
jgi:signal transduction histidine kinase